MYLMFKELFRNIEEEKKNFSTWKKTRRAIPKLVNVMTCTSQINWKCFQLVKNTFVELSAIRWRPSYRYQDNTVLVRLPQWLQFFKHFFSLEYAIQVSPPFCFCIHHHNEGLNARLWIITSIFMWTAYPMIILTGHWMFLLS